MDRKEAIKKLKKIQSNAGDTECDHVEADKVLCALLESLGYKDVVREYRKIEKWFA